MISREISEKVALRFSKAFSSVVGCQCSVVTIHSNHQIRNKIPRFSSSDLPECIDSDFCPTDNVSCPRTVTEKIFIPLLKECRCQKSTNLVRYEKALE